MHKNIQKDNPPWPKCTQNPSKGSLSSAEQQIYKIPKRNPKKSIEFWNNKELFQLKLCMCEIGNLEDLIRAPITVETKSLLGSVLSRRNNENKIDFHWISTKVMSSWSLDEEEEDNGLKSLFQVHLGRHAKRNLRKKVNFSELRYFSVAGNGIRTREKELV